MRVPSFLTSIPRRWRTPRAILSLFIVELLFSVAALALYGIAQPDLYRTRLWKEGSNHGWNSNPKEIIYAYANYRPIPTPLPWSQFITNFNVVIAVLSLFILLVKGIMFITHVFHPLLSAVVHAVLVALYAVSIHAQTASDMSDPKYPQKGAPWYITKGCGAPVDPALHGYCQQATGTLAVTVLLWYVRYLLLLPHLESHITTPDRRAEDPKEQTRLTKRQHPLHHLPHPLPGLPLPHCFPPCLRRFEDLGFRIPITPMGNDASPANARYNRWAQIADDTADDGISDAWRRTESGEGAGKRKG